MRGWLLEAAIYSAIIMTVVFINELVTNPYMFVGTVVLCIVSIAAVVLTEFFRPLDKGERK